LAARISDTFTATPSHLRQFQLALEASGFRADDSLYYCRPFTLRRPLGVVHVGSAFPAITRTTIVNALGPAAPRIESVQYDVDIEGLEHEDGTPEFGSAISGTTISNS
jgi:hypothetical protein